MYKTINEDALTYHEGGKIATQITKPCDTQLDLSLAYTPGVAIPCKEIQRDPSLAYKYTAKGNLVAVITDGSAVLGLGDIGALAGKPVMEGKAVLFKKFANVDAVDILISERDPDKIVDICVAISDTFGGINLEDISAPRCFEIERKLQARVNIPVMHDDQHGTAIITTAGLMNVLETTGKDIEKIKIVIIGAGAAGIACGLMYKKLGAKNIIMVDSKGIISTKRTDLNDHKKMFAIDTDETTLAEAMSGADMMLGLSGPDLVSGEMVKSMADNPIIFACSNPTPEIMPDVAHAVRDDLIMGTGRSDFPNQVNNVLGFPFIFRGALDVRASKITENMKMAAAIALANLAKEPIPYYVKAAYDDPDLEYGKYHIIPKPFNKEICIWVSAAVAEAAIKDGVANVDNFDLEAYKKHMRSQVYLNHEYDEH
ncbi:MAG TPA: malate dehydrogenase [Campylobacterales bacterium]|nr:malate dehydrogenase [Campylobacterales bacterium]HIP60764.1 malate dehydrogenase [Campylobacterales bacterium]